jgi:hypothetical protein
MEAADGSKIALPVPSVVTVRLKRLPLVLVTKCSSVVEARAVSKVVPSRARFAS